MSNKELHAAMSTLFYEFIEIGPGFVRIIENLFKATPRGMHAGVMKLVLMLFEVTKEFKAEYDIERYCNDAFQNLSEPVLTKDILQIFDEAFQKTEQLAATDKDKVFSEIVEKGILNLRTPITNELRMSSIDLMKTALWIITLKYPMKTLRDLFDIIES